jgi:hypothetical protein
MTIEIRELVIHSEVVERRPAAPGTRSAQLAPADCRRLKEELLVVCREWLREQLQQQQER